MVQICQNVKKYRQMFVFLKVQVVLNTSALHYKSGENGWIKFNWCSTDLTFYVMIQ